MNTSHIDNLGKVSLPQALSVDSKKPVSPVSRVDPFDDNALHVVLPEPSLPWVRAKEVALKTPPDSSPPSPNKGTKGEFIMGLSESTLPSSTEKQPALKGKGTEISLEKTPDQSTTIASQSPASIETVNPEKLELIGKEVESFSEKMLTQLGSKNAEQRISSLSEPSLPLPEAALLRQKILSNLPPKPILKEEVTSQLSSGLAELTDTLILSPATTPQKGKEIEGFSEEAPPQLTTDNQQPTMRNTQQLPTETTSFPSSLSSALPKEDHSKAQDVKSSEPQPSTDVLGSGTTGKQVGVGSQDVKNLLAEVSTFGSIAPSIPQTGSPPTLFPPASPSTKETYVVDQAPGMLVRTMMPQAVENETKSNIPIPAIVAAIAAVCALLIQLWIMLD